MEEPLQGWISRGGALTLITTAIAKGFLKVVPTKAQINADLVPVDYVANAMIACAYKTAMEGYVKFIAILCIFIKIQSAGCPEKNGSQSKNRLLAIGLLSLTFNFIFLE